MPFYDCDRAMVITTGYFTNQAVQYAEKVDDTLMTWIKAFDRAARRDTDRRDKEAALRKAQATRLKQANKSIRLEQANRLKKELVETDSASIVSSLKQNTVPVLRTLAILLGLRAGKDSKSTLVKRIATRIKTQRAARD